MPPLWEYCTDLNLAQQSITVFLHLFPLCDCRMGQFAGQFI
jgi:hypothetical protein